MNRLQALVTCDSARRGHKEQYRSIKLSTYGIMFFGTPHAGATGADFQAFLTSICRIVVPGTNRILRHLRRDSEHLQHLSELYLPISLDFKTIFFYEEYETPLIGGMSMMVNYDGHCLCLYCSI
jgi:hypothetical protein